MLDFKEKVLEIVRNISRGGVMSYGEVARRAGFPGASRAVGSLMKANRDSTVPCHRVVLADGSAGQFNQGGTLAKIMRLQEEGLQFSNGRVVGFKSGLPKV